MIKCNKCNSQIPDDSEFCQYCGTSVSLTSPLEHTTPHILETEMSNKNVSTIKKHNFKNYIRYLIIACLIFSTIFLFVQNNSLNDKLNKTDTRLKELRKEHAEVLQKQRERDKELLELREKEDRYILAAAFVNKRYKFYVDGEYHYITCDKVLNKVSNREKITYTSISNIPDSLSLCSCMFDHVYDIEPVEKYVP